MLRRSLTGLGAVAVLLLVLAGSPASAAPPTGWLRIAHLSPDTAAVDVYLDDSRVLSGLGYRTVSQYLRVAAGQHTVALRPAGGPPAAPPVLTATAVVAAGGAGTVAAVGPAAQLRALVLSDDLTAPPRGMMKGRIIAAIPTAPVLDVLTPGQPPFFTGVQPLTATPYLTVPAGTFPMQVQLTGTDQVVFQLGAQTLPAGAVMTFIAVGELGARFDMIAVRDAIGTAATPRGGVATGAGGTAGNPLAGVAALLLMAAAGATAAVRARPLRR